MSVSVAAILLANALGTVLIEMGLNCRSSMLAPNVELQVCMLLDEKKGPHVSFVIYNHGRNPVAVHFEKCTVRSKWPLELIEAGFDLEANPNEPSLARLRPFPGANLFDFSARCRASVRYT